MRLLGEKVPAGDGAANTPTMRVVKTTRDLNCMVVLVRCNPNEEI